jgi:sugar lactone lactonase YvrE
LSGLFLHCLAPPIPHDGICANATWNKNGTIVAGGNEAGSGLNQLNHPTGLFVDDDDAIYVADGGMNHRVVKWRPGDSSGQVVAGGNGEGDHNDQLDDASSVVVDKNGTMFICDSRNTRVQRWVKGENQAQTIIANILCWGLTMDNDGSLYVDNAHEHAIKKWPSNQIVAGGNGEGPALNQLRFSAHIFVDRDNSVFVADSGNHRVMKWVVDAKEGIVVAGGNGQGNHLDQLGDPQSMIVDRMGTVYVADWGNHRIMRWFKGFKSGSVIVEADPQSLPIDLRFDRHGNLYVVDYERHHVKMYAINKNSCSADRF